MNLPTILLGKVVHPKPCPDQCQGGHYISCHHGANCDCPGQEFDCDTCDGRGEVLDEDCVCELCMELFHRLTEHRYEDRH